jgi:hypothetical protein
MIRPADPYRAEHLDVLDDVDLDEHLDGLVEYRVDPDARPGDVTAALAKLLIHLARRRRGDSHEAPTEQQAGSPATTTSTSSSMEARP